MLVCEFMYIYNYILNSKHCKIKYSSCIKYNYIFFPITSKSSLAENFVRNTYLVILFSNILPYESNI